MHLTPTERRIFNLLIDGVARTREEVKQKCMGDPLAGMGAFYISIHRLRKKLEENGKTITVFNRQGIKIQITALITTLEKDKDTN